VDAPQVKAGKYTVVVDPNLGGVFAHEAFGHQSESDKFLNNPTMRETLKLGRAMGTPVLGIYDTGLTEGSRGHVPVDDEGVPGQMTWLVREGTLVGRLHSRESAAWFDEKPTGNARAISFHHPPICRMRNTCIANGESSFEELLDGVKEGVYAVGSVGGSGGEMFTFTASYGHMIRDGKVAELVRDVSLSGNLFITLKNIDAVGNDFLVHDGPGGCGTRGQMGLPVSHGAPHFRIRQANVGGA
jgi:TldD protein